MTAGRSTEEAGDRDRGGRAKHTSHMLPAWCAQVSMAEWVTVLLGLALPLDAGPSFETLSTPSQKVFASFKVVSLNPDMQPLPSLGWKKPLWSCLVTKSRQICLRKGRPGALALAGPLAPADRSPIVYNPGYPRGEFRCLWRLDEAATGGRRWFSVALLQS